MVLDLKSKGYGPKNWPSDVSQIQDNKISLTPVEPDLFWRGNLAVSYTHLRAHET